MTETLKAIELILALIQAGSQMLTAAMQVSALVKKAQDEGRDITRDELDQLVASDDAARALLESAIKNAS